MKLNWGTGILIVLILFLLACAGFIFFAMNQEVNLVHRDYYERGVDYSEQMNVDSRSLEYSGLIKIEETQESFNIKFEKSLVSKIDSGNIYFYYPASRKMDLTLLLQIENNSVVIPKNLLQKGRYEVEVSWFSDGLKYEVSNTIILK